MSQYDWLKGNHMTKVVWLPKETDYSYSKLVPPNTPYCKLAESATCLQVDKAARCMHICILFECLLKVCYT